MQGNVFMDNETYVVTSSISKFVESVFGGARMYDLRERIHRGECARCKRLRYIV